MSRDEESDANDTSHCDEASWFVWSMRVPPACDVVSTLAHCPVSSLFRRNTERVASERWVMRWLTSHDQAAVLTCAETYSSSTSAASASIR